MKLPSLILSDRGIVTNDWQLLPLARVTSVFCAAAIAHKPENTQRAQRSDLNFYLAYLGHSQSISTLMLTDHTVESVAGFVEYRLQFDKPETVVRRVATLRSFDKWLRDLVPEFKLAAKHVTLPVITKAAWKGLSPDEVAALVPAAYTVGDDDLKRLRNGLCVETLFSTGLRISEALGLKLNQLSKCGRWFRQVRCKGRKFRDIYVPAKLDRKLSIYISARTMALRSVGVTEHEEYPVFVSFHSHEIGRPESFELSQKGFWRVLAQACERAQMRHVSAHKLRHTFAHTLLEQHDMRFVAQALGHSDVSTTMRYTERSEEVTAEKIERSFGNATST